MWSPLGGVHKYRLFGRCITQDIVLTMHNIAKHNTFATCRQRATSPRAGHFVTKMVGLSVGLSHFHFFESFVVDLVSFYML
jgi:hypothetical protein